MKDLVVIVSLSIMVVTAFFVQEPTRFLDPSEPTISEQLASQAEFTDSNVGCINDCLDQGE